MNQLLDDIGFTILEMVVVMAILSIVMTIGALGINSLLPAFRMRSAVMELKSDMQMARLQAIRHNVYVVSQFDADKNTYTIFHDDGGGNHAQANNYVKDAGEKIIINTRIHPHITIRRAKFGATEGKFAFNSRGAIDGLAGGIYLQHRRNLHRGVAISRIGKITIKTSADGNHWHALD
jgi:prepilin-type N-terminal cleavage/methylation domain-containing protein